MPEPTLGRGPSRDEIIEEIMIAQADLQTALGVLRLSKKLPTAQDREMIEDRLARSLARSHALLRDLGNPMYEPATHPDVKESL